MCEMIEISFKTVYLKLLVLKIWKLSCLLVKDINACPIQLLKYNTLKSKRRGNYSKIKVILQLLNGFQKSF